MTNILVPTDFTLQSLDIVEEIVRMQGKRVRIYLLHMIKVPTDAIDMLFMKKSDVSREISREFTKAIFSLKEKYPKELDALELKLYYGSSNAVFNSITENLGIEEICLLNDYSYSLPLNESVNLLPLINRSELPVYRIERKSRLKKAVETRVFSSVQVASMSS